MEYAIPLALVVLVITALISLFIMRTMRSRGAGSAAESPDSGPGIAADDDTPLADTSEHAGDQHGGEDVGPVDAESHGGAGRRHGQGYTGTGDISEHDEEDRHAAAHVQRPGEGEGGNRF